LNPTSDQFRGCLLGAALGDALGAPFEGGPVERCLWKLIGVTRRGEMRWTDDTQMTIDLAESILATGGLDESSLAEHFARSYRWSRGYGPATAKVLKRIRRRADWQSASRSVYRDGSFGNGAAMRAPILGLIYAASLNELAENARRSAAVTHAHPLGIEGAVLIAVATNLVAQRRPAGEVVRTAIDLCVHDEMRSRLVAASDLLATRSEKTPREVAVTLGNKITAVESCVTAIYLALRFLEQPFLTLQHFIAAMRGDVDTIGAMAGAIWGTANGSATLPGDKLSELEQRERIEQLAASLHRWTLRPARLSLP
jgi:poly(ADP-ribose) glycohydrolase ARH3